VPGLSAKAADKRAVKLLPAEELADLIAELTEQMHVAAAELKFEIAARLRDELGELKKELRQMREAGMA
jgi:excinuclease ABC subunit B